MTFQRTRPDRGPVVQVLEVRVIALLVHGEPNRLGHEVLASREVRLCRPWTLPILR